MEVHKMRFLTPVQLTAFLAFEFYRRHNLETAGIFMPVRARCKIGGGAGCFMVMKCCNTFSLGGLFRRQFY